MKKKKSLSDRAFEWLFPEDLSLIYNISRFFYSTLAFIIIYMFFSFIRIKAITGVFELMVSFTLVFFLVYFWDGQISNAQGIYLIAFMLIAAVQVVSIYYMNLELYSHFAFRFFVTIVIIHIFFRLMPIIIKSLRKK